LLLYTLVPILVAWLYGEFSATLYYERYLILVQPGYLLAAALGIVAVADGLRRRVAWGATILAGALALLPLGIDGWVLSHHYFDPTYAKPDWRATARIVEAYGLPGDAVVITGDGSEKAFGFYYRGDLPVYTDFNTPVPPEDKARQIIADIAATHRRIWYTPYGLDVDATLESWLAKNAYPAWQSWLARNRLMLLGGSTVPTDRRETLNAPFADPTGRGPTLVSLALPTAATAAGDVLPLAFTWQTATRLEHDYRLSLRLSNSRGDVFVQSDWPPVRLAARPAGRRLARPMAACRPAPRRLRVEHSRLRLGFRPAARPASCRAQYRGKTGADGGTARSAGYPSPAATVAGRFDPGRLHCAGSRPAGRRAVALALLAGGRRWTSRAGERRPLEADKWGRVDVN
jgi:hypothetical protein